MVKVFRLTIMAIAATIALQLPTTTAALAKEKWVYIGNADLARDADCFRLYVDMNSLKRNGDFAWFWWRTSFIDSSEQKKCRVYDDRKFQFIDYYLSVDCRSGASRFRDMRTYDKNRKLVPEYSGAAMAGGALFPLDRNFLVLRYVC